MVKGGGTKQHETGCSVARVRRNDSPALDPLGAIIQIWGWLSRVIRIWFLRARRYSALRG